MSFIQRKIVQKQAELNPLIVFEKKYIFLRPRHLQDLVSLGTMRTWSLGIVFLKESDSILRKP